MIGNNGILRKKTRIAIVNEYRLVECMDRIILMQNRHVARETFQRDSFLVAIVFRADI